MLFTKDHQVALPMAEFRASVRGFRPKPDPGCVGKHEISRLTGASWPPPPSALRQVAGQILALAGGRVDPGMDGLMAKPVPTAWFDAEPAGDLLGRPALSQPLDRRRAQLRMPRELALSGTAIGRELPRRHWPLGSKPDHPIDLMTPP